MKPSERGQPPHNTPQWIEADAPFFITICCNGKGENQLCLPEIGSKLLQSAEFYHTKLRWNCVLMLLMPDHLHAIMTFPRDPGMKRTISDWKHYQSRFHNVLWQRDFFDHHLRNHHEEAEKLDYIVMNPVRKGLCERAEDWVWVYRPNDRLPPKL